MPLCQLHFAGSRSLQATFLVLNYETFEREEKKQQAVSTTHSLTFQTIIEPVTPCYAETMQKLFAFGWDKA